MKELLRTHEQMKLTMNKAHCRSETDKEELKDHYANVKNNLETIYEEQMIETVDDH